jgi:acetyl esterase
VRPSSCSPWLPATTATDSSVAAAPPGRPGLRGIAVDDPYHARLRAAQTDPAVLTLLRAEPELIRRAAAQAAQVSDYEPPVVDVTDGTAPGPHGPVAVRVYLPPAAAPGPRPLLVWCHGGGWCEGDLDMPEADATSREVCTRAGAVVVSVDYRLATAGVFYPLPLDDVLAAWGWAITQAPAWGASVERAVLGGASAGGNLAAGAALRLRDGEGPTPASLALVYPALHAELPALDEVQREAVALSSQAEDYFRRGLTLMLENYVGGPVDEAPSPAVPALAELAGLPPTLVMTCAWDVLRSSGEAFASALERAAVPLRLLVVPEIGHGHLNSPWLPQAQQSYQDLADWVAGALTDVPR